MTQHFHSEENHIATAKLVTFILETELWRTSFLWEHEYNIHLFIHHIKERPARVLRYVRGALKQLLGEEFSMEQYRLRKVLDLNLSCNTKTPQPYKPKPQKLHTNYKRQPAKPRSVFGKKYLEHYGYGCTEDMAQYYVEYKYYHEKGHCRWEENEKEG